MPARGDDDGPMRRWLLGLVVLLVMSSFALLLLHGRYVAEGPVVLSLSAEHGVHEGDIVVVVGWLIGVVAQFTLLLRRSPTGDGPGAAG
jgi:hypothetical protein